MIDIKSKIVFKKSPRGMAKAFAEAREKAMADVGRHWHGQMLPKHFEESAFARYKYEPRSPRYVKRKERKYGHRRPLVFTGTLMRTVLGAAQIRATSRRVTVRMSGPRWLAGYIAFRGRAGRGPDKRKELTMILKNEGAELATIAARRVRDEVQNSRGNPPGV